MAQHADLSPRAAGRDAGGLRLARQLSRLLPRGRFAPLVLWLRDGRRIGVQRPTDLRVRRARGTIRVTALGDAHEILFEDLLAIELLGRTAPPG